ncbi:branched-chain amino acid ABC transporter permease [Brucella thiophenivorans]|uniref:Branched-chain amino acid transport system / permease component family protein n=1 Tax=Brucella thiophenivorans TaxID=571255 RepID=A0A256FF85_9HYPH|nr:branched-chain amino acid ABC transporter permease [Brucella thiophenivorans]OYR13473.1 branched-chain amino acid transport system / permease component family protein [Brucella thiophenivorans]
MKTLNNPYFQFLLAVVAVLVMPLLMKSGILATEILIFALAVTACNLLLGYTGLLSFGQGIFFGSGSYIAGILLTRTGIPAGVMLPLAVVGGAALAALVGWFAIRRQGVYFVMLTLAFSQLFFFLAYTFSDITGGDNGLLDVPRPSFAGETLSSPWSYYVYVAIIFLVVFALLLRVIQSTFGRTLIAIRENEERAIAVGYPIKAFKVAAFAISGAVTALAGALHAMLIGVAPLTNIEHHTSEVILIMTIIGGSTSLIASVIGAASYLLLADWLSVIWPRWLLLLGLALIVVSLFAQKGLWGLLEKLVAALSSKRGETAKPEAAEEK